MIETRKMTLPTFVIIGAEKAGTSSLAFHLRQHPDVYMARGKETRFFYPEPPYDVSAYASHFAGARAERAIGEASPSYLYFEHVPQAMVSVIPDARLIAVLRDPVDRAYSHYWMNRAHGVETMSFADAIEAEPRRLADASRRTRAYFGYLDRGRYRTQLQRYADVFGRDRLLVLLFEALRDDPARTYAEVCRFIGVDDRFVPGDLGRKVNPHVDIRSLWLRRVSRSGRWPKPVSDLIGRLNSRQRAYPPLDEGFRRHLSSELRSENRGLARWLDRDLAAWGVETHSPSPVSDTQS